MPTDDGVLLRKALLSEDCIKDLVRPLREAGWSVEVGEPDERALFVTVVAKADGQQFGVALLYSCATDNGIYRRLADTSVAILYRGPPYNQQQYAYGIDVNVGPVTGWLPPMAPNRKSTWRSHQVWRRVQRRVTRGTGFMKPAWKAWRIAARLFDSW